MLVGAKQHGVRCFLLPNISEKLGPMFFFFFQLLLKNLSVTPRWPTQRGVRKLCFSNIENWHTSRSHTAQHKICHCMKPGLPLALPSSSAIRRSRRWPLNPFTLIGCPLPPDRGETVHLRPEEAKLGLGYSWSFMFFLDYSLWICILGFWISVRFGR